MNNTIYVVVKNEVWDGENWDCLNGAFIKYADAQAELKRQRDKLYDDWKDETIDTDDADCFCAYEEGYYDHKHICLYIEETTLTE